MSGHIRALLVAAALIPLAPGCSDTYELPKPTLYQPVDFTYACEAASGVGHTVAPSVDPDADPADQVSFCQPFEDTPLGGLPAEYSALTMGMVLDQELEGVVAVSMGGRLKALDADDFIPGYSPIRVGKAPIRLLRAPDWDAFYAVNAGSMDVTRIVVKGYSAASRLDYETTTFDLPGAPGNAAIAGATLWVSEAWGQTLWAFDLAADPIDPPVKVLAVPDLVDDLVPFGDGLLVTYVDQPLLSWYDASGAEVATVGLVPACADGLDNDGDGVADAQDPECYGATDEDEGGAQRTDATMGDDDPPSHNGDGPALCRDGIDNDNDGATDEADPSCQAAGPDSDAEKMPECGDGLDNDGDGLVDTDDPACYGSFDLVEGHKGPFGPFAAATVDGGDAGRFVYVLDMKRDVVLVFEAGTDSLTRVDVVLRGDQETDITAPDVWWYETDEEKRPSFYEIRVPPRYGPSLAGEKDVALPYGANAIYGIEGPGKLWTRLITQEGSTDPVVPREPQTDGIDACALDDTLLDQGLCGRPDPLDDYQYVAVARLDGRVSVIESVVRGEPLHRLMQSPAVLDPEKRTAEISSSQQPTLYLRNRKTTVEDFPGGEHPPFLGPSTAREIFDEPYATGAERKRQYGIWPVDDPEAVTSEQWNVEFEGVIPGTSSVLGRFASDTELVAPEQRFCERGVLPGDLVVIYAPPEAFGGALGELPQLVDDEGRTCATEPVALRGVQLPVDAVGMDRLTVDPGEARLVPPTLALDEQAILDGGGSVAACTAALDDYKVWLGTPESYELAVFSLDRVPARFGYEVRTSGAWTVVGRRSGFLHRNVWDETTGTCTVDESLDARRTGRAHTADLQAGASYATCPPADETLSKDAIGSLVTPESRFSNFSFGIDILPGCVEREDGSIELVTERRGTEWIFSLSGPDLPLAIEMGAGVIDRFSQIDHRRQLVLLDSALGNMMVGAFGRTSLVRTALFE